MMYFCLLIPSLLSIAIINRRNKLTTKELVLKYPFYVILINIISLVGLYFINKRVSINLVESFKMLGFTAKYLILSTALAYVIPYVVEFIKININISLDFKKKDKKNEK